MTVQELIDKLSEFDLELEVCTTCADSEFVQCISKVQLESDHCSTYVLIDCDYD